MPIEAAYSDQSAFKVEHFTCYAQRALERVKRADEARAKSENRPDGWDDGRHYFVQPYDLKGAKDA